MESALVTFYLALLCVLLMFAGRGIRFTASAMNRRNSYVRSTPDAAAQKRAEALLHDQLDDEQKRDLATTGWFGVPSSNFPWQVYRICRDPKHGIHLLEDGEVIGYFCFNVLGHPGETLPDADVVVGRKLWVEGAELEFRRTANYSAYGGAR